MSSEVSQVLLGSVLALIALVGVFFVTLALERWRRRGCPKCPGYIKEVHEAIAIIGKLEVQIAELSESREHWRRLYLDIQTIESGAKTNYESIHADREKWRIALATSDRAKVDLQNLNARLVYWIHNWLVSHACDEEEYQRCVKILMQIQAGEPGVHGSYQLCSPMQQAIDEGNWPASDASQLSCAPLYGVSPLAQLIQSIDLAGEPTAQPTQHEASQPHP